MSLHKIFREMFNAPPQDIWDMREILEEIETAKADFERVGVPFTYESFIAWCHRGYDSYIQANSNPHYADKYKRYLKIIEGDNLDKIEDAAKDRGLL
jgi:hypothetical protein